MNINSDDTEQKDLRRERRTQGSEKTSVEFIPGNSSFAYHFKLRDFSSKGFGIIVRKDSKVLESIKTGDIMDMKYYPLEDTRNPETHRTQIKHISEFESKKDSGHMLVGLLILE